ncbi:MAG: sigma-70 family RNA polymerase sigma factor [Acidimicrobiales bacterium]
MMESLVAEHGAALQSFATRLTGDWGRAEEIVQETLLRAWKHPEALDGTGGSARGWLFTVTRNLVNDSWRRQKRDSVPSTPEPLADLDRSVDDWVVSAAVGSLSADHRQVLFHTIWLGQSVAEAARAIGVPAGTVKSRTYYALRALRLGLEENGFFT